MKGRQGVRRERVGMRMQLVAAIVAGLAVTAAAVWWLWPARGLSDEAFAALYAEPLAPPAAPVDVYHLGHSLVGQDMPAMLAAAGGHDWAAQLGWGASLKNHLDGAVPGFDEANANDHFQPVHKAAEGGAWPVVVLTEMVELRDSLRYHDAAATLAEWARRFRAGNPAVRLYLYETWHHTDDGNGWLARIDRDLPRLWEGRLLRVAMAEEGVGTIHVIPGGQAMAALVRAAARGDVPGVSGERDFITDTIHFTDLGAWAMAMTHYAVIYGRTPEGLPAQLPKADGTLAGAPSDAAARAMQAIIWRVVTHYPPGGVPQARAGGGEDDSNDEDDGAGG